MSTTQVAKNAEGLILSVYDAEYIVAALREKAARELEDAKGRIHNAKLSRLDAAEKLTDIAERVEAWKWAEQERQNERARPKHLPRRTTIAKATGEA